MIEGTKVVEGWTIPDTDVRGFGWIREDLELVPRVLRHVRDFSRCVQAGGNVGLYPMHLAQSFNQVITFEPQPLLFACLEHNIRNDPGILSWPYALADKDQYSVPMKMTDPGNMGTWRIVPPAQRSSVMVPAITLDFLEFKHLGLIWLDVEGMEIPALIGAMKTIKRCRPVIVLEIKDLGAEHGFNEADAVEWVKNQGYQLAEQVKDDFVFTPCESAG